MKPITLNLLAEEQQAEQASAHDPVKYAIAIGIVILALTATAGVLMMMWAGQKKTTASQLQKRWEELTASQTLGSFRSLKLLAEDLVAIHRGRALLAPEMARFKDLIPPSIFLMRMSFKLNVETTSAPPPPASLDGSAPKTPPPPRAQNLEYLFLRLDGTAAASSPVLEVDQFLQAIRADIVLSNQMKSVNLRSIGQLPSSANSDGKTSMAQFVIECAYKEVK